MMLMDYNISTHSVFGEYEGRENQVTAALLHVIRQGGEPLLRYLIDAASGLLPDNDIFIGTQVACKNQGKKSVFDGVICSRFSFTFVIESKVEKGALTKAQVDKYHDCLKGKDANLLAITPDEKIPQTLHKGDLWLSWDKVVDTLNEYNEENENEVLRYLIDQFVLLLSNLGIYDKEWKERVIIVGGSFGEPVALDFLFYACQSGRYFQRAKYLAFACKNRIAHLFEIVGEPEDDVDIKTRVPANYFTKYEPNYVPDKRKLFMLKVMSLPKAIQNDNTDKNGKRCAFTQRQKYTTIDRIMNATHTSQL